MWVVHSFAESESHSQANSSIGPHAVMSSILRFHLRLAMDLREDALYALLVQFKVLDNDATGATNQPEAGFNQ